ncbi:MAG TPA: EamA family transporter RarD [Steroidobacteraceae bacterium]|nr:EamA family transporter RarD [Steroidobacteraceae bacterium]
MNWGVVAALGAYLLWGLFPLYFKALIRVPPLQILAHRMVWSVLLLALIIVVSRRFAWLRVLRERPSILGRFAVSAFLLAYNWGMYIWAINNGHVVDASLGYYINPLLSVVVGACVLAERLRPQQWLAVAVAAAGVTWMTIEVGHPPWIALTLALSFALYGLMRKTAIPLLLFAFAARRIPLSLLGILQYSMPTVVLALGVWRYHEPFGRDRALGFGLVWVGVAIYLSDALWRRRWASKSAPAGRRIPGKPAA